MAEWLGLEWVRVVWAPMLTAGCIWLATAWKKNAEDRSSRDQRLDSRLDKEVARIDAELEEERRGRRTAEDRRSESEREKDRVWFAARRMEGAAHDIRHEGNRRLMNLSIEHRFPKPDALPELPSLQSLLPKSETSPTKD